MEPKKQLIAIRLKKELLQVLDAYAKMCMNGNRSQVISAILDNVICCSNDSTIRKLINTWDAYSSGYVCQFERPKNM